MFAGLIRRSLYYAPTIAAAVAGATWDPTTATPFADWTPSNGNLTVERTANSSFHGYVRATTSLVNGSFSVTIDALSGAGFQAVVGIVTPSEVQYPGNDAAGYGIGYFDNGNIQFAAASVASVATYTVGDVIKIVKTGAVFDFYKNGVLVHTEDTSTFGVAPIAAAAYPEFYSGSGFAFGSKATADFSLWV
jgi:hypothetical protein